MLTTADRPNTENPPPADSPATLLLVSHALCPYVQRVDILLREKGVAFLRRDIDLADKPAWFKRLSPLGRVPALVVDEARTLFESDAIGGYIDETFPPALLPDDAFDRARQRGWTAFASSMLDGVARLYNARTAGDLEAALDVLRTRVARLESEFVGPEWFCGEHFGLVDAAFAPVFRYFDVIDGALAEPIYAGAPAIRAWRRRLAARPSVQRAVSVDYPQRLRRFVLERDGDLARRMRASADAAAY